MAKVARCAVVQAKLGYRLVPKGQKQIGLAMRKLKARREAEWQGLTESEVRSKLDAKLPGKVPAEKRQVISDKVVSKMRDRGMISEDSAVHDDAADIAADEAQPAEY